MNEELKKIRASLERSCAKREYCVSDVMRKALAATGGVEADAREVVESLVNDRFVDDARYAAAFAREKSSLTGWGPVRIRMALKLKGISPSVIGEALQEIDAEKASDKLSRLLAARRKSLEGDPYIKFKLIKYALSRGYEYDQVASAVEDELNYS